MRVGKEERDVSQTADVDVVDDDVAIVEVEVVVQRVRVGGHDENGRNEGEEEKGAPRHGRGFRRRGWFGH